MSERAQQIARRCFESGTPGMNDVLLALREMEEATRRECVQIIARVGASCPYMNRNQADLDLQAAFWRGVEQVKRTIAGAIEQAGTEKAPTEGASK